MQQNSPEYTAWQEELPALLHEISLPVFPEVIFDITEYGAIAGGTYSCTKAVQAAIDACALAGGGKVVIPPGTFLSAGLYLRSNVNLHLQEGAVLLFFTEPEHYLPLVHTRWEGIELFNYAPMLYAYGETNIAITGSGILDGQASAANWWCWRGQEQWGWQPGMPCQNDAHARSALFAMGEQEVPLSERVFGPGFYLRPNLVQFYQCEQVLVEGVRLQNAPMWALHPVRCKNVTLQHLHISTHGPSGDGCNPESCCRVLIRYCHFDVSHDAIALKSGRNREGRRLAIPCEKVVIQHCSFAGGHGGITLGSESSGGIRKVYVEDCEMDSPDLYRALRIKTSSNRGGIIEHIYLRNIVVQQVSHQLISISKRYEDKGHHFPTIRHVYIRQLRAEWGGETALLIEGYPEAPVRHLQLTEVDVKESKEAFRISNIAQLHLEGVSINGKKVALGSTG